MIMQVVGAFLRSCRFFVPMLRPCTVIRVRKRAHRCFPSYPHKMPAGTVVTADHAVKTRHGWKRVRDTGAIFVYVWQTQLHAQCTLSDAKCHSQQTPLRFWAVDAIPLSEADAAAEGDVLFDILTESHQFSTAQGVVFADYEEVDDVTPENYARLIQELNLRDFGRAQPQTISIPR